MLDQVQQIELLGKSGYCGSAVCIALSWLGEYAAGIGVIVAISTLITSIYFQKRRDKREKRVTDDVLDHSNNEDTN